MYLLWFVAGSDQTRIEFGSNSDRIRAAICYGSWQVQRLYSLYLIDSHEVSIFARARATPGGKAPSRSWRSSRITPAPPAQACYWLEMRSGAARNRVPPKTRPADPRPKINFELASQLVNKCCDIEVYHMASVSVPARPCPFWQVRSNCLPVADQKANTYRTKECENFSRRTVDRPPTEPGRPARGDRATPPVTSNVGETWARAASPQLR